MIPLSLFLSGNPLVTSRIVRAHSCYMATFLSYARSTWACSFLVIIAPKKTIVSVFSRLVILLQDLDHTRCVDVAGGRRHGVG